MTNPRRRTADAIDALRDDPEVIVIRRTVPRGGPDFVPHWTISTAGHNSHHTAIHLDALLTVQVLMEQQERTLP